MPPSYRCSDLEILEQLYNACTTDEDLVYLFNRYNSTKTIDSLRDPSTWERVMPDLFDHAPDIPGKHRDVLLIADIPDYILLLKRYLFVWVCWWSFWEDSNGNVSGYIMDWDYPIMTMSSGTNFINGSISFELRRHDCDIYLCTLEVDWTWNFPSSADLTLLPITLSFFGADDPCRCVYKGQGRLIDFMTLMLKGLNYIQDGGWLEANSRIYED